LLPTNGEEDVDEDVVPLLDDDVVVFVDDELPELLQPVNAKPVIRAIAITNANILLLLFFNMLFNLHLFF